MKLKKENGITLIALIVTIIVLLILAGVAIITLTGENGILTKAANSKERNNYATAEEEIKLKVMETQADKLGKATLKDIVEKLQQDTQYEYIINLNSKFARLSNTGEIVASDIESGTISDKLTGKNEIYVIHKGYEFEIDMNMNVTGTATKIENGDKGDTTEPTEPSEPSEPVEEEKTKYEKINGSDDHTLAIDIDGKLWTWGSNRYGQLGDGTNKSSYSEKINIKQDTKFKQIEVGFNHSMALDESGNLWAWGDNQYGQLGNGTKDSSNVPILVKSGTKFTQVSSLAYHTIAMDESGNIWYWGRDIYGAIGASASPTDTITPSKMASSVKFKQIVAGGYHYLLLDENGELWTWGNNTYSQLGNGKNNDSSINDLKTITKISTSAKFKYISSGIYYNLAIDMNGNIWGWGQNLYGQIGNGTIKNVTIPTQITTNGIAYDRVIPNKTSSNSETLAIDSDGYIWAWGQKKITDMGIETSSRVPVKTNKSGFKDLMTNDWSIKGIQSDGEIYEYNF